MRLRPPKTLFAAVRAPCGCQGRPGRYPAGCGALFNAPPFHLGELGKDRQREDWTPTFLAAAGVPDVKEQLLKGYKGVDRTYKVHLDAYDMTALLSGKGPGQRKEIFYFDDSGSLNAFRYNDWKVTFATKDPWWADVAKPRTVPLVINLRQDPFEMTQDSAMYTRWYADKLWVMVPAQAIVGQFLSAFKDFPPRQTSATVNVQKILEKIKTKSD